MYIYKHVLRERVVSRKQMNSHLPPDRLRPIGVVVSSGPSKSHCMFEVARGVEFYTKVVEILRNAANQSMQVVENSRTPLTTVRCCCKHVESHQTYQTSITHYSNNV